MLALYLATIDSPEEQTKFTQVYEKYRNLMFYVADGILKDEMLSEDAVQNAFLNIAKNIEKIEDVDSSATKRFVTIVVENVAKRMYQKEKAHIENKEFNEEAYLKANDLNGDDDSVFRNVSAKEVVKEILRLPETHRKILYLYEIYGCSFYEIANLLDMKPATVRKIAQRARETVKELQDE